MGGGALVWEHNSSKVTAEVGLTGDLTFSKNEYPATGAIFSSQNASIKIAKLFLSVYLGDFLIYTS
jgi:hypothetical protein